MPDCSGIAILSIYTISLPYSYRYTYIDNGKKHFACKLPRIFPAEGNIKGISIPALIATTAITVDMILSSFLDVLYPYMPAILQIILFISIAVVIYGAGQKLLKNIVDSNSA